MSQTWTKQVNNFLGELNLFKEIRVTLEDIIDIVSVSYFSHVCLFASPHQISLSMGLSRQECWGGLPFPFPGDFFNPGIKHWSPVLQTDSLLPEPIYQLSIQELSP